MHRRLGLKARFIGLIVILLTAMFFLIAVILIDANTSSLRTDLQDRAKAFAALATTPIGDAFFTYQDSGTFLIEKQVRAFQDLDPAISNIAVVGIDGNTAFKEKPLAKPISATEASTFDPIYQYQNKTISRIIYPYITANGSHSYAVVYDVSSSEIDQAVQHLVRAIVLYTLAGLIVSAAISYFFIDRLFLQPVKRLRDRAMLIADGNYNIQIPQERNDEIGDLAKSTNQMAESLKADIVKLQEADKIKSEFMMIAAHNLRTPLTIIKGYLSLAESMQIGQELQDIVKSIGVGTKRLERFAEDIITISSLESGKHLFTAEKFEVRAVLQGLIDEFQTMCQDKNITFKHEIINEAMTIDGSPLHLRSALWNLLQNAYKFTDKGGQIDFSAIRRNNDLVITVKDSGIGISPEEMSKLFTKFHRGTDTTTYDYEGTGVGLYVTKLIITEHKGTITVDSTLGKGSAFTVTLPVSQPAPADADQSAQDQIQPVTA